MWSSNGFWNLVLLGIWVVLAILAFTTFRGTETALNNIAWPDSRQVAERWWFGTASFEWASMSYTDEEGNVREIEWEEAIQDFCIDVLGN